MDSIDHVWRRAVFWTLALGLIVSAVSYMCAVKDLRETQTDRDLYKALLVECRRRM